MVLIFPLLYSTESAASATTYFSLISDSYAQKTRSSDGIKSTRESDKKRVVFFGNGQFGHGGLCRTSSEGK